MAILNLQPTDDGLATVVTARSGLSGNVSERTIEKPHADLVDGIERHRMGALIQNVFPDLSTDDREFLMTGITPEEWDAAFA